MANNIEIKELLDAGVHFGHLTRKWNPNMAPYIYMERNGIHVINLYKTAAKIEEAAEALKKIVASGKKVLFVATKKQAKDVVAEKATSVKMPYITERWPGGMLTNFPTIRKAVKKMSNIDKMMTDGTYENMSKRERLQLTRVRAKLEKNLGGIKEMKELPGILFIIDTRKEEIAIREARSLGIPIIAVVDTNCNPEGIDYPIPGNDDAIRAISLFTGVIANAVIEADNEHGLKIIENLQEDEESGDSGVDPYQDREEEITDYSNYTPKDEAAGDDEVEEENSLVSDEDLYDDK